MNNPTNTPAPTVPGDSVARKKPHQPHWREKFATVADIEAYLADHILLRRNAISQLIECRWPGEYPGDTNPWEPLTSTTENTLWKDMSRQKPVRAQDLQRVINSDYVATYHPYLHYLQQLPRWDDRQDHLRALSMTVQVKGTVDDQLFFAHCLKKWLVGMVATWVNPQVVNNVILVLIGQQGAYKTTWFSRLLPPELRQYFYTKTNATRMDKDDRLKLAQYGLICCEELDTMTPRELNQLKAAVTMLTVDERLPYERYPRHLPHIASFCGTGNNTQFLTDQTGNRRWLPFEVDTILPPDEFPVDYTGVYAQAWALYRQGFQYWFNQAEMEQLNIHNQQFEAPKLEHELVDTYFRKPLDHELGEFMPVSRALQIVGGSLSQKLSPASMGKAFTDLGFAFKRTNTSRGYIVVQRTPTEIKARQHAATVTGDG